MSLSLTAASLTSCRTLDRHPEASWERACFHWSDHDGSRWGCNRSPHTYQESASNTCTQISIIKEQTIKTSHWTMKQIEEKSALIMVSVTSAFIYRLCLKSALVFITQAIILSNKSLKGNWTDARFCLYFTSLKSIVMFWHIDWTHGWFIYYSAYEWLKTEKPAMTEAKPQGCEIIVSKHFYILNYAFSWERNIYSLKNVSFNMNTLDNLHFVWYLLKIVSF